MTREELIIELRANNIQFKKIRFHKQSPYQKRRYKPEYIGWEAWIYTGNDPFGCGFLITQEDWESRDKPNILEAI